MLLSYEETGIPMDYVLRVAFNTNSKSVEAGRDADFRHKYSEENENEADKV